MIYLLYTLYAYLDGQTDAFLYSGKGAHSVEENEHSWLVTKRIIAFAFTPIGFTYALLFGWQAVFLIALEGIGSALAFSFWHNGAYNIMRARINGNTIKNADVYKYHWQYSSPTDTSKLNFTYPQRFQMVIASIITILVSYICFFFVF